MRKSLIGVKDIEHEQFGNASSEFYHLRTKLKLRKQKQTRNYYSHSTLLMLASFPVGISHGELVEIREQRRNHWVRGSINYPTRIMLVGAVRLRLHYFLHRIPRVFSDIYIFSPFKRYQLYSLYGALLVAVTIALRFWSSLRGIYMQVKTKEDKEKSIRDS